jgi:hypothetical protein
MMAANIEGVGERAELVVKELMTAIRGDRMVKDRDVDIITKALSLSARSVVPGGVVRCLFSSD